MELKSEAFINNSNLSELGKIIIAIKDDLLRRWEAKVRENISQANELSGPILIDTLPAFIDKIAEAVTSNHFSPATIYNTIANEHGGERARLTNYTHEHLIREYQILRSVFLETILEENIKVNPSEMIIIHTSIDEAIQHSASNFALVHNELRNHYIATLSHDMKTPLTSISMSADLLLRKTDDPQTLRQAVKIKKNSVRITKMIDDLLDVTALKSSGRLRLRLEVTAAKEILEEIIDELESSLIDRIEVSGSEVEGYWDRSYLKRAFENLVNNAFKYSEQNGRVQIQLEANFGRFIFKVHNYGPPIPPQERESIFQVFRRAEAAKKGSKTGWGLGLPLVRAVAESHGGSVGVESSAELGTTFVIDIPQDARPFQNAPTT